MARADACTHKWEKARGSAQVGGGVAVSGEGSVHGIVPHHEGHGGQIGGHGGAHRIALEVRNLRLQHHTLADRRSGACRTDCATAACDCHGP